MTPKEYRESIARLGLSQEAAGEFFGVSARQGQRWANNEREIPVGVAIALRLMLKHKYKPEEFD